jgi:ATP-dependent helicase/nuclease subunit A
MTRAKEMLVISSTEPHRPNAGSWWERLEAFATPLEVAPIDAQRDSHTHETFTLQQVPSLPARAPIATTPVLQEALSSRLGQAMHRLLEIAAGDVGASHLRRVAREFALDMAQAQQAAQMAQRIASGEGAWAWDVSLVDWHANEVPLHHAGELLRIDRLVRRGGEWWVLDFKSAAQPQEKAQLVEQMRRYRAALMAIHPGVTVRAAFLTAQGRMVVVD